MTIKELKERLAEYDENLPIVMHLGDTLSASDGSIEVANLVWHCAYQNKIATVFDSKISMFRDADHPKDMCSKCRFAKNNNCVKNSEGTGEHMREALQIVGDWND